MQIHALCNRYGFAHILGKKPDWFLTNSTEDRNGRTVKHLRVVAKTLRVMQLTAILLTVFSLTVTARSVSQTITFSATEVELQKVFNVIKEQTGFYVLCNQRLLNSSRKVTVNANQMPLMEFLTVILKDQPLIYSIRNTTITVKAKTESAANLSPQLENFPPIKITGTVVGVNNQPLAGATIRIKGKNIIAISDEQGRFEINADAGSVLVITYIGFEQREFKVTNTDSVTVTMLQKMNSMDTAEVVFSTGFQNIPEERATGSFVQIDNELFNRTTSTNVLDRILTVTNSLKFEPNSPGLGSKATNISIRGFSTINANMRPLIVVDGFPYVEGEYAENGILTNNPLQNLNPNDVESVTILRDAAAASIWGAQAGNGVIVITTKKGKFNQKAKINFNTNVNIGAKPDLGYLRIISPVDAVEYERSIFNTGYYNDYDDLYPSLYYFPQLSPVTEVLLAHRRGELTDTELETKLNAFKQHDVRDDLNRYMLRTQVNQQYNLNISGGAERYSYYASVGYDKNKENTVGNDYSRFTLRMDNTFRPVKNLELNGYIVYTQSQSKSSPINYQPFFTGVNAAPYTFLADENGNPLHIPSPFGGGLRQTYVDNPGFDGLLDWHFRPLDELRYANNVNKQFNARLGGSVKYTIIPGLSAEVKGQYERGITGRNDYKSLQAYETRDLINRFMYRNASGQLQYPVPLGGILDFTSTNVAAWNLRSMLNLNRAYGRHRVDAIAGMETREREYDVNRSRKYGYDPNTNTFATNVDHNTPFAGRPNGNYGNNNRVSLNGQLVGQLDRFVSYFGNAGYTLDNKYTVTASARIDGSNFFGVKANQRLVPLWSAGAKWNISKESFYQIQWMSHLQFRATYGYNGNMDNGASALPTASYDIPSGSYHGYPTLNLRTPPNPGLSWERVGMVNLGLDFTIFNNRISGNIEYYTKKGIDLIGSLAIESTVGVQNYITNYAGMTGRGWDIQLNTVNIDGPLRWSSNLLFSYNKDKVTDFRRTNDLIIGDYLLNSIIIGDPLLKVYSYPSAGLDPETGAPRGYVGGKIVDFNTVLGNTTKPADLRYHGTSTPTHFGSFRNTFSYQNISLSFNIVYKFNYYFRRNSINYNTLLTSWSGHSDYALRWQKPGDEAFTTVPALPANNDQRYSFYQRSSDLVEKGDHIRLQDVRLEYLFTKRNIPLLPFSDASIFMYANNLGIIWRANKQRLDPDSGENIPRPRTLAFGLQVNF